MNTANTQDQQFAAFSQLTHIRGAICKALRAGDVETAKALLTAEAIAEKAFKASL
jgi:hypothetical protein